MRVVLFVLIMITGSASADICPIPPIPPIGCEPVCVCDEDGGNCTYIFECD